MSTVLIVSRTRMKNGVCVGGIDEATGEFIRLHNDKGGNLGNDAPYQIGERWNIRYESAWNRRPEPHVEDKQTTALERIEDVGISGIRDCLSSRNFGSRLTNGQLNQTFEGKLQFQGWKAFISKDDVCSYSTQFWVCDEDLLLSTNFEKRNYRYRGTYIPYVGFQDAKQVIPKGTILRLSLANWWSPDGGPEKCYLQISGYY